MPVVVIFEDVERKVEVDTDAQGNVLAQRTIDKLGRLANETTLTSQAVAAMANLDTIISTVQAGSPSAAQLRTFLGQLAQTQKGVIRLLAQQLDATN